MLRKMKDFQSKWWSKFFTLSSSGCEMPWLQQGLLPAMEIEESFTLKGLVVT
jgi:hypothetical protein